MLKVAIVGCGKIADAHAAEIQRIENCRIVGVCDREELMAKQLQERFPIDHYFSDVAKLLEEARPDVVHITTPPQSHYSLGRQCLERGCHVYIEKPFTLNTKEAEELIELAQALGAPVVVPIVKDERGGLLELLWRRPLPRVAYAEAGGLAEERLPALLPRRVIVLARAVILFAGDQDQLQRLIFDF